MTIIAAAVSGGVAAMGSDTMLTMGGQGVISDSKIFAFKGNLGKAVHALVGFSGDNSGARILKEASAVLYVTGAFLENLADEVRRRVRERDGGQKDEDGIWCVPFEMLVVTRDGIWLIERSLTITRIHAPHFAIGSGREYAIGAMEGDISSPDYKVATSCEVAIKHCTSCGGPVDVQTVDEVKA